MNAFKWLAACLLLALPASAHAIGASLSIGGGVASASKSDFRAAAELSPFYDISILRLEVPLELQLKPTSAFSVRPGAKLILPVIGIYGRLGYGLMNLTGDVPTAHSLIVGLGWQLTALDVVGIFFEGTYEPSLDTGGVNLFMARAGALLNL